MSRGRVIHERRPRTSRTSSVLITTRLGSKTLRREAPSPMAVAMGQPWGESRGERRASHESSTVRAAYEALRRPATGSLGDGSAISIDRDQTAELRGT